MSAWLLIIAVCIGICLGFIHGILMLLSPTRHRRFVVWLNSGFRRSRLSPVSRDVSRGLELEYRLAGLAILVMCGWLAWELQVDVRDRLFKTREHPPQFFGSTFGSNLTFKRANKIVLSDTKPGCCWKMKSIDK